jgi:hypothetical protein
VGEVEQSEREQQQRLAACVKSLDRELLDLRVDDGEVREDPEKGLEDSYCPWGSKVGEG